MALLHLRPFTALENALTAGERKLLRSLDSPFAIQRFLDDVRYSAERNYRSPLSVLRDRKAHCFDGAVFGAMALRRLDFPALIVEMLAVNDDGHLLALFRVDGCWGAVAKSNFIGLRYREPIHRTLRELMLSYFEDYYNINGEKTLRSYRSPLNLRAFDRMPWTTENEIMNRIAGKLDRMKARPLITRKMANGLSPVDALTFKSGLLVADPAGLHQPTAKKRA